MIAYNSLCKRLYTKSFYADIKLLEEDVVKTMAENFNTTHGDIALNLNWSIPQDVVNILAAGNHKRMSDNI